MTKDQSVINTLALEIASLNVQLAQAKAELEALQAILQNNDKQEEVQNG